MIQWQRLGLAFPFPQNPMTRYKLTAIGMLLLLASCGGKVTPSRAPTSTRSPLPISMPAPTDTPVPGALTAQAIYERVSPSIAFVDVGIGSGTGVLSEQGYLITNAHVVWPFETVRVVFPNGTEIVDAPVAGFDLMADLAVIGPLAIDLPGLPFADDESQGIGSRVYLIGYPAEVENFPQASLSQGVISRRREWEQAGITFLQSDAAIAGGQSGGALVSERGELIGISGLRFGEGNFALAASAVDVEPRRQALIAGKDVDQLGDRLPFGSAPRESHTVLIENRRNRPVFVVNEPLGTEFEAQLSQLDDYAIVVNDIFGDEVASSFESAIGTNRASFKIEMDAPYFLTIMPTADIAGATVILTGSKPFWRLSDPDDGQFIQRGRTKRGSIDLIGEADSYQIVLEEGEEINIKASSMLDAVLALYDRESFDSDDALASDDDSGRGVFGLDPELTFRAPESGMYVVEVFTRDYDVGGYFLTVDTPYAGAPTPIVPTPTVTPIASEVGDMRRYRFEGRPRFSIQYPAGWLDDAETDAFAEGCESYSACFAAADEQTMLMILVEDLEEMGWGGSSQEEYADLLIEDLRENTDDFELIERQRRNVADGRQVEEIEYGFWDSEQLRARRLVFLHEGVGFNAIYVLPSVSGEVELIEDQEASRDDIERMIDYSFDSFDID